MYHRDMFCHSSKSAADYTTSLEPHSRTPIVQRGWVMSQVFEAVGFDNVEVVVDLFREEVLRNQASSSALRC